MHLDNSPNPADEPDGPLSPGLRKRLAIIIKAQEKVQKDALYRGRRYRLLHPGGPYQDARIQDYHDGTIKKVPQAHIKVVDPEGD